ncbi:MAG: Rid family detoxifying hydrolase [Myxococcaceae bacterium]
MRVAVQSHRVAAPVGPFSAAVRFQGALYVSGQVAQDPSTGDLILRAVPEQTARGLENIRAILEAAGRSLDDVVRVEIYLTDIKDFAAMNKVYATYFAEPYPARTTIAVKALPLGAVVEIDVVAADDRAPATGSAAPR